MEPYQVVEGKQVFPDYSLVEPGYGVVSWSLEGYEGYIPRNLPLFSPYGVKLVVCPPEVDPEPALRPEPERDELYGGHYSTLIEDGGLYRLWYLVGGEGGLRLCYAESEDCVNWRKPSLGVVEYGGSRENNIVDVLCTDGGTVFLDPSAPEHERYKYVYSKEGILFGATSPDGVRWRHIEEPILREKHDTQNVCFYDTNMRQG